jgi:hypothetical protein
MMFLRSRGEVVNRTPGSRKTGRELVRGGIELTADGIKVTVPSLSKNPLNGAQGSWRASSSLRKTQRIATALALSQLPPAALCERVRYVHMVRLAPGLLDCDSVPAALKSFRDQVAAWIAGQNTPKGVGDDGPRCGIRWTYDQLRQRQYGVLIELHYAGTT